jgi:hypothetical protein
MEKKKKKKNAKEVGRAVVFFKTGQEKRDVV